MSDHGPTESDHEQAPQSSGIPTATRVWIFIALGAIVLQGALVVIASTFGRVWPAINSTKLPLP